MARSIFITATDTDAGKTWVTKHLIYQYLAAGIDAQALKPIASGVEASGINIDVEILLSMQKKNSPNEINFHTFQNPVAPALAGKEEGYSLSLERLLDWQKKKERVANLTFIEGIGGLMTPLVAREDEQCLVSDWLVSLPNIEVVLVAPLQLGCMNQILLSCKELASMGKPPSWLVLNDLHNTATFLETRDMLIPLLQNIFKKAPEIIGIEKNGNVSGITQYLKQGLLSAIYINNGEGMSTTGYDKTLQDALETDLRLHPQQIELGQAEMLTDALLHRFDDLEQRLNTYISGSSGGDVLRKGMQSYLSRLNANPLIPLHFRLKVLKRFEEQLDLFDAEMTAAILNAHKIGIDMVQKEAQSEPAYYRILVDMISHAIELAGRLMRDLLATYQSAGVITVRQVFDLMRLGMIMVPELSDDADAERNRLYAAIIRYEMLRNLDFFRLTTEEQAMVMDELKHHIAVLKPYYLKKGDVKPAELKGSSLLVSNLSRPHETAKILPFPPDSSGTDYLLVPIDGFIDKLVLSVDRAEKVLKDPLLQSKDIQIENSLQTTVVGGNAILDALRTKSRNAERQEYGNAKLNIDWSLLQTVTAELMPIYDGSMVGRLQNHDVGEGKAKKGDWSVLNISREGLALERLSTDMPPKGVGFMVGLDWSPHRGEPAYAFIRWIRFPKPGEQQIGMEFYLRPYVTLRAIILNIGDTKQRRTVPILATFEEGNEHTVLFPEPQVAKGMAFSIAEDRYSGYFKVSEILDDGPNYSLCIVRVATELG